MAAPSDGAGTSRGSTKTTVAWIACCLLALGAGYLLGQRGAAPVATSEGGSTATREAPSAPPADAADSAGSVGTTTSGLREVLRNRDPVERARRLATDLPQMGPEVLPEVEAALSDLALNLGAIEYVLLVRCWARHDPKGAYDWALRKAPNFYRDAALEEAAYGWALQDPLAAVQGIAEVSNGPVKDLSLVALTRGWYASGEPGLLSYIIDLGQGFDRQRSTMAYVHELLEDRGGDAAVLWAEGLSDEDAHFKQLAFTHLASELGLSDPKRGIELERKHGTAPHGEKILERFAARWVLVDPDAALRWLSQTPPGPRRDRALKIAVQRWRDFDRAAMLDWVAKMGPEGVEPWFQPALSMYAMAVSRKDPERALEWAAAIESKEARTSTYVSIAQRWRRRDAEAAEAWIAASELSEEQKANAMMDVEPRRRRR